MRKFLFLYDQRLCQNNELNLTDKKMFNQLLSQWYGNDDSIGIKTIINETLGFNTDYDKNMSQLCIL